MCTKSLIFTVNSAHRVRRARVQKKSPSADSFLIFSRVIRVDELSVMSIAPEMRTTSRAHSAKWYFFVRDVGFLESAARGFDEMP